MAPLFLRFTRMLCLSALGWSLVLCGGLQAQERPDYGRFRDGVFLRYLNASDGPLAVTPHIGLSFGERTLRADLDSGSTGIVVAAALVPGFGSLPSTGEGRLTYTSSGRVMIGQWVVTPLSLVGQNGARIDTEPMPILAVTRVECLRESRDCTPEDGPRNIAMVGVGFAREHDRQTQSTPDKNPLLRIPSGGREQRRGYVLTPKGIHVGLTAVNTEGAFSFIKLARQPDIDDWAPIPACIGINGQQPAACGSMLVDTGVSAMFMTLPPAQAGGGPLPPGTQVTISTGIQKAHRALYSFSVDGGSPLAPSAIHLQTSAERVFVNTSFHLLNGFDVLYDADGGYAAFRPH
ncbi:hypothetical protein [Microvirga antarctica]|uniref:hypothetical protein n=1 Tax=Microvirga antarctica TaxID=2819233 RepID=UPI001FE81A64|nr:hypothetical protein [Microvirga antarctica]